MLMNALITLIHAVSLPIVQTQKGPMIVLVRQDLMVMDNHVQVRPQKINMFLRHH